MTDQPTDELTNWGARGACMSKNRENITYIRSIAERSFLISGKSVKVFLDGIGKPICLAPAQMEMDLMQ